MTSSSISFLLVQASLCKTSLAPRCLVTAASSRSQRGGRPSSILHLSRIKRGSARRSLCAPLNPNDNYLAFSVISFSVSVSPFLEALYCLQRDLGEPRTTHALLQRHNLLRTMCGHRCKTALVLQQLAPRLVYYSTGQASDLQSLQRKSSIHNTRSTTKL